jgi:hypothetical protein
MDEEVHFFLDAALIRPLQGDQLPMPCEDGVGRHKSGHLLKSTTAVLSQRVERPEFKGLQVGPCTLNHEHGSTARPKRSFLGAECASGHTCRVAANGIELFEGGFRQLAAAR